MKKKLMLLALALCLAAGCGETAKDVKTGNETKNKIENSQAQDEKSENSTEGEKEYQPVTITVELNRAADGEKVEQTFTAPPKAVVAKGDQMADFFFDLGLEGHMAGYTHGSCFSTVSQYPARDRVPLIGDESGKFTKEELLSLECDFLVGWDSTFSEKNFDKEFCQKNNIAMYPPYCTYDKAEFEEIYKDYEVLGKIFAVEDLAKQRVDAMKAKIQSVKDALGSEVYENPVSIFAYDSGTDGPFTACKGMPGNIFKLGGGISIFDDIDKGWATVSWEQVVDRNPEVIFILDYNGETPEKEKFLRSLKALENVPAIKNNRIYSVNCADMQGSAGSANAVEIIAKAIYPDRFK